MANEVVNTGSAANDNTGDPLREAFALVNQRFVVLAAGQSPDAQNIVERVETARDEAEDAQAASEASEVAAATSAAQAAAARDAAFTSADVYASTAAGLSGTSEGEQFQIVSGDGLTLQRYRHDAGPVATLVASVASAADTLRKAAMDQYVLTYLPGKNMYNPAAKKAGKYVGTNGVIVSNVAWGCTDYIPVVPGQSYTISSNATKRVGLAFFETNTQLDYIVGSYSSASGNPLTVTAPAGANFLMVNLYSNTIPEPSEIQIEKGTVATAFTAWIPDYPAVRLDAIEPAVEAPPALGDQRPRVFLAGLGSGESYVEAERDGLVIRRTLRVWPTPSLTASSVINPVSDIVGGVMIRSMGDDAAPYRALGTTIGANHGYAMYSLAMTGHGKTTADIGSVYTDGTHQIVIVGINGANAIWCTSRFDNSAISSGTYTHVSGGTNTADIVAATSSYNQMYPPFANRVVRVIVDGVELAETSGEMVYRESVQFVETYDVHPKNAIVEWFVSTGGPGPVPAPTTEPAFSVSITWAFDHEAQCTVYTDFLARSSMALQDIMFLQAGRSASGADGTIRYYIPKTLPVTHEGTDYDYAAIDSSDTSGWSTRLDFTPARCEPTGILADRVIQLGDAYGFAMGYLPVQTAGADRRTNSTVKALQVSSSSGKIYLSAVDNGSATIPAGTYHSVIGYRNIVIRKAQRTSQYVVRTQGADYLYLDWHTTGTDKVPVPGDLVGRPFEVVEKSSNVTVLSEALTAHLTVSVGAGTYGYLILKVS